MKILNLLKIIIIAIIEGITEWLPISSTGHMIIFEEITDIKKIFVAGYAFYDLFLVVIQLGAVSAVFFKYFRQLNPIKSPNKQMVYRTWINIIACTIPAAIIGYFFDDLLFAKLYNIWVVALMLILYGIIFLFIDKLNFSKKEINIKTALIIGLFQVLALIPGTSRSGILIIAGILIFGDKIKATEFSFLGSIPIIVGASILKILKYQKDYQFVNSDLILLIIGMLVSFITSLLVLDKLIKFVRTKSLKIFGVYRIAIGIIIFLFYYSSFNI